MPAMQKRSMTRICGYHQGHRRARAWWAHCPFIRGATGMKVPFHNRIQGNLICYQNRPETNLLQLFAHPEYSQWFSIIPVIVFEVNIVAQEKQAYW